MLQLVGLLAVLVMLGSLVLIYGARQARMPAKALTVTFALTAASWLAFLIAAIGATVTLLALPQI